MVYCALTTQLNKERLPPPGQVERRDFLRQPRGGGAFLTPYILTIMNEKLKNVHRPCDSCGHNEKSMWQHPRLHWKRICNSCLNDLKAKKEVCHA